ncbi:cytidine deaminase [bacterium]|nr:cytidine deaminase [bacterium]
MAHSDEFHPEMVIGLVSAVGTDNWRVIRILSDALGRAGYDVNPTKISKDVIPIVVDVSTVPIDYTKRVSFLMDKGNEARTQSSDDGILAYGAAARIFASRTKDARGIPQPRSKTVQVIDSLKRPEEVAVLRQVYGSGFVLIGVHEEGVRRRKHLAEKGVSEPDIDNLIERDAEEKREPHGQRVNKTFHLADFFVKIEDSEDQLNCDVWRIVKLMFGDPFVTPTFDEFSMFMAFSAALRSADLSRQVGAVVTINDQILATGANDCPRRGGGLYWAYRNTSTHCVEDEPNGRDYKRDDGDSNRAEQIKLIKQIADAGEKRGIQKATLIEVLEESSIGDLTEYGRVVHAEMEALLSCARNGASTVGTTLFCTTFPCHNCAKHIIAAGVSRVVYVEPYPKSKAIQFHDDSIRKSEDESVLEPPKVRFEPFVGIGPRKFFDLFSMELGANYSIIRKDGKTGLPTKWDIQTARLRIQANPSSYLELEAEACKLFPTTRDAAAWESETEGTRS